MSRERKILVLTVLWVACTIVPGALAAAGAFGDPPEWNSHSTGSPGWVALAWIVGYLLQIGVWMVLIRVARLGSLWWIGPSLLPWAVDWLLPVGVVVGLLVGLGVAAFAAGMYVVAMRKVDLVEHGLQATGEVVAVLPNWMNVVVNNVYRRYRVRLRVHPPNAPPYERKFAYLAEIGTGPDVGDRLPLLLDPDNPRHFILAPADHS